jgi:hypothetical protein
MALSHLFKLAKLIIDGYEKPERAAAGKPKTFEVQYNPETLTMRHESVFQPSAPGEFSHGAPEQLSVDLVVDGTNVSHLGVERLRGLPTVAQRISDFLDVCYNIKGETHEPLYLTLRWDNGVLDKGFDCRLQSVDIRYTAFDRDVSPLHADLAAVFVKQLHPPKEAKEKRLASPDLTHRRVVLDGDTLPLLCREIYGSPLHYLRVAQVNGLDDFRSLVPGQELIFPPFERPGRD